jgi:hypothetical protein
VSRAVALLALLLAGCAAAPPAPPPAPVPVARFEPPKPPPPRAPGPLPLRNPDFAADMPEDARCPPGWSCTVHGKPDAFRFFVERAGGKAALCVEPVKKEPWAIAAQGLNDPALRGARLRFSIATRLVDVAGAGAGPWSQVQRARAPRQTVQKLSQGSSDWKTESIEFDVPADAITVEAGLMFRGTGRACFGEARVEVLQGPKNPV